MCNKTIENCLYALELSPECYKSQETCHGAVYRWFFVFDSIPNKYKTQEICNLAISLYI